MSIVIHYPAASNRTHVKHRESLRVAALEAALADALAAADPPDVMPFARRDCYAESLAYLARCWQVTDSTGIARHIHAGGPFLPYRLAVIFGAIKADRKKFWIEDLRKLGGRRASKALAAYGEIDWSKATRDVRAAYLYGAIVRRAHDS